MTLNLTRISRPQLLQTMLAELPKVELTELPNRASVSPPAARSMSICSG